MKYHSTRSPVPKVTFSEALRQSLAPDGGLFVPERFPKFRPGDFTDKLPEIANTLLSAFLDEDDLLPALPAMCRSALNFPIPLKPVAADTLVLELFHGPTAAFKDVGARFLAECISRMDWEKPPLVLVATSGDTGGAVAGAFHGKPGVDVCILYPKGKISPRQEKQLTCWGGNVKALAINGVFDDCQRIAKEAFADKSINRTLVSANSISIGRLLPQTVYYAASSMEYFNDTGVELNYIIPTGNLGNACAAMWARKMGFPIGRIVCVSNANRAVPDYLNSGHWAPRQTVETLANAMDVGNPSNMERVLNLYPDFQELCNAVEGFSVSDAEIRDSIRKGPDTWNEIWCPHTATAAWVKEKLPGLHWCIVSTAHPAKFESIVEPLVGEPVTIPPALKSLLGKPSQSKDIEPTLDALKNEL